jgi:aspartyl-tRNA(Asn)/glutamyl-tRNA(Gln) amidotransferase subunit B
MSENDSLKGYTVTIGLEVHAELKTKTKMFCNSKNDPDEERPNVNICPICMGYPGTLPTINKQAVEHVLRVGTALGGTIADFTEFDRKNYFYPDIPKGYQITQYKYPLVSGGSLRGIALTRIHLEEDTASSSHTEGNYSLVDFNRAGVPLMELVTEPVIHSASDAAAFAKELQVLLQALGAGDANLEKGEMRVEANISVSKTNEFGTKVEVKNLNSFRAVERAIDFEVARHIQVLEEGGVITQETRGWDETKESTFSQRAKEDSHDYRYFPEPDLPKIWISKMPEWSKEKLQSGLPELPWEKRARLTSLGLKAEDAEVFVKNANWGEYFSAVQTALESESKKILLAVNYLTSDLAGLIKKDSTVVFETVAVEEKIPAVSFAKVMNLISSNVVSSAGAKQLLAVLYSSEDKKDPTVLVEELGLAQKSDEGELTAIAQVILDANPSVVADYKGGKVSVLQFFLGQGMKATKGSANPEVLKQLFEKLLG